MRVILHADDLGISSVVNESVFCLLDEGRLTSASILANGPEFREAARLSKFFPHCSFGMHLNLTEFAPLLPSAGLAPFLSSDGSFQRKAIPLRLDGQVQRAVVKEWRAQIACLRNAGVTISHIDSHHHIHTRLALLPCLLEVCAEEKIDRVRLRHTFTGNEALSRWRIDNLLYNWTLRQSFTCTDEFGPLLAYVKGPHRLPESCTAELMVHPGHENYSQETSALTYCGSRDFLSQHERISYLDLN
ncbi:YdjC-like protein [Candidatus Koribacter versatilis Ellin345]|uniref:YdjC-like protein n=2 Tax=Candidatus Korobacter versatilis TaxID=658062 RepID=Q1ING4_KORVE|nr:YdjC-like protein [Candidatus Koribacter versatilis Ellin345]